MTLALIGCTFDVNISIMRYLRFISVVLITICGKLSMAQSLAINTDGSTAHSSAMLDIKSNNQGLLIPRLSSAQRTGIVTPAQGLQVYDTDLNLLYFFNGTTWAGITPGTNYWTVSGSNLFNNTGTKVGIGTTIPSAKLHVGSGTRFTVLDTGSVFLQSGNTIGSARDWKIAVTLPNGYLTFRDMGFDNSGTGAMSTDAMVMQWGTGNVGIGSAVPSAKLDVGADFKLGAAGSIQNALIKTTQNIDVNNIAAGGELDITVAVPNAGINNSAVFVSPATDIEPGILIAWARVSAINTVKIRFRNNTAVDINPAAINYVIAVLQ